MPLGVGVIEAPTQATGEDRPPNLIILLVDDWGWWDAGCFGSDPYETPHIDRLAAEGVKFTDAYAARTVCSPTRGALLTGQYPARTHLTDFIPGKDIENQPVRIPDWTQRLEPRLGPAAVLLAEREGLA